MLNPIPRSPLRRYRGFEGAAGGRRWDGLKPLDNLNAATFAGGATLARRAQHLAINNPWMARAVNVLVSSIVGCGIKPYSQHPDARVREAFNAGFARWSDQADANGLQNFFGQQASIARALVQPGEGFARLRTQPLTGRLDVPLRIELLAADQIDAGLHRDMSGGARIRAGVEFDSAGVRTAYHVRDRPGDPLSLQLTPRRIPASEMLHVFLPLVPGQVRGVSWMASVLLRLHTHDQFEDATLAGQAARSMFAGFITETDGNTPLGSGEPDDKVEVINLEPATYQKLRPGEAVTHAEPASMGDGYAAFMQWTLRAIAAGIGVTYEQLTGDMTGVNFSSARVALIEYRRWIETVQEQVLIHQYCRPVWERFVRLGVLSGTLSAPGFERDPRPYLDVKWIPPGWSWIDPKKDVEADILAMDANLKSRSEIIARRGVDPEKVDEEIAADALHAAPRRAPAAPDNPNEDGDRDDDDD